MHIKVSTRHVLQLCLALAAVAVPSVKAQQATPPDPPPPHGQVLFEHHDPLPADDPAPATAPPPTPTPKPGISSSQAPPHTLHRRTPADTTTQSLPETIVEAATDPTGTPTDPNEPILITALDRQAAQQVSTSERTFTSIAATALDLHLDTHTGATEARAQLTLRNTGTSPLTHVPLRISGALHWESARLNGTSIPLTQYHLPDDLDHTGVATELALTLPQPLAPGATASLDLYYAGVLTTSTQRLLNLGAPAGRALATDWDTVSDTFTGLRGLGDVLWYPVTAPPALLKDGPAVPLMVEQARIAAAATSFRLHLTLQYTGTRPEAAFFCGQRSLLKPLTAAIAPDQIATTETGVVTADWNRPALGPHTPSIFIAQAAPHIVASGLLRVVTDRADTAAAMGEAASRLKPMLTDWLGVTPPRPLDIVDLPIPGAAGFTDGALLVAHLTSAPAGALAPSLVGPLATAWLPANIAAPWLRDGIPAFLQAVWAERTEGRTSALSGLAATRTRLAGVDAATPPNLSSSASSDTLAPMPIGPPLATCAAPACTRAKAAYVFEMLRGMLGDAALQQALSGWRISEEKMEEEAQQPGAIPKTAEGETASLESLLQQVAGKRDLHWFFSSWIDADHGLPELSIVTVAPRRVERNAPTNYLPKKEAVGGPIGAEPVPLPGDPESIARPSITPGDKIAPAPGSWIVAVEVQNAGSADAEVPVTVRSGGLTNSLPLHVPAHGRATIRVPFEAEPEEVIVNDGSVPETRTSQHRRSLGTLTR